MKSAVCVVLLVLTCSAFAQTPCDPEVEPKCTVGGALEFYRTEPLFEAAEDVATEVVNTNRPTTSPDPFAARVHNSYQDFLNLLSFAVNDVDEAENGEAIVVRFNPLRHGNHLLGLTLAITKPAVSEALEAEIPEPSRVATVALLEKQLGDTDDQTWSASYSFASTTCLPADLPTTRRCWGRKPSTYGQLLSLILPEPSEGANEAGASFAAIQNFYRGQVGTLHDFQVQRRADVIAAIKAHVAIENASVRGGQSLFDTFHLDLLPRLIDNQPQLTASATYHRRPHLGGPNERSATVEFHSGRHNINMLRKACHAAADAALTACLRRQLDQLAMNGLPTDKYVLTFTYKKSSSFSITDLGLETPVVGFTGVNVPSASEYNLKVQAGRELGTEVMGKQPRADLSFEGIRTEDDGTRTKNRWVGAVTLSIPLGGNMTIPISLSYANKPEFLEDQNESFGAHFGLSYRLPDLFGGPTP